MAIASKITTREKVKLTAKRLFRERGYAAVGMRELAEAVGIRAPSLYNHYKSKDDILREICFELAEQFYKAFEEAAATEDKSVKKLRAAIKAHISVIAANIDSAEVFFHEWIFLEQPNLSKFKKLRFEYEMMFRDIIDKGIKRGDFKKMNSKLTAFTIFSALNATYEFMRSSEKYTQEQMAEDIADLLLKGLKA